MHLLAEADEDRVDAIAKAVVEALSACPEAHNVPGELNMLLVNLALAQTIGSNNSCMDQATAQYVRQNCVTRMAETEHVGRLN